MPRQCPSSVRRQIVLRLQSGEAVAAVVAETGVCKATLFRWKRQALIDAGVIDGSKALRKAVVDVFDHPVIQRCQLHKVRNVKDHLPQRLRSTNGSRMTDACHAASALEAVATLLVLAQELNRTHPGATAIPREDPHGTLTVLRMGVPPTY